MSIKPPITDLPIETDSSGFYEGFNKIVALGSKILIGLLILWAAVFPDAAGNVLKNIRSTIDANRVHGICTLWHFILSFALPWRFGHRRAN